MNRKKKGLTFVILIISISVLLAGCGGYNKIAKEKYENEAKPQLLEVLRSATELEDLDFTPQFSYNSITNNETQKIEVVLECKISYFDSDEIDEYYTTENNSKNAINLAKLLNDIKDIVDDSEKMNYTYIVEGNEINIVFIVDDIIRVKTSDGRLYSLQHFNFDDTDVVEINGDTVYREEKINSSTSSKSNNSSSTPSYRPVTDKDTMIEVWIMAELFVKDKLKSPKSADFPWHGDDNVEITYSGNSYRVIGYVDAENSFGAMIRATFILVMEKNGDNYTLKECNIIE